MDEVDFGVDQATLTQAISVHYQTMFAAWISSVADEHSDVLTDYAIEFARMTAEEGKGVPVIEGMVLETEIWRPIGQLFENYDVLDRADVRHPWPGCR